MATRIANILHRIAGATLVLSSAYFGTVLFSNMNGMYKEQQRRKEASQQLMESDVVRFSDSDAAIAGAGAAPGSARDGEAAE